MSSGLWRMVLEEHSKHRRTVNLAVIEADAQQLFCSSLSYTLIHLVAPGSAIKSAAQKEH